MTLLMQNLHHKVLLWGNIAKNLMIWLKIFYVEGSINKVSSQKYKDILR